MIFTHGVRWSEYFVFMMGGRTPCAKILTAYSAVAWWVNIPNLKVIKNPSYRNVYPQTNKPHISIDPPGHGRIGGHYIFTHGVRPFVRHQNKQTRYNANVKAR